jgi:hypothetical protein
MMRTQVTRKRRSMEKQEVEASLDGALEKLAEHDRHLLLVDVSERCIASRL